MCQCSAAPGTRAGNNAKVRGANTHGTGSEGQWRAWPWALAPVPGARKNAKVQGPVSGKLSLREFTRGARFQCCLNNSTYLT